MASPAADLFPNARYCTLCGTLDPLASLRVHKPHNLWVYTMNDPAGVLACLRCHDVWIAIVRKRNRHKRGASPKPRPPKQAPRAARHTGR